MHCLSCGAQLPTGAKVCPNCGTPTPTYRPSAGPSSDPGASSYPYGPPESSSQPYDPTVVAPPSTPSYIPPTAYGSSLYAPPQQNPYAPPPGSPSPYGPPPPYVPSPPGLYPPTSPPFIPAAPQGQPRPPLCPAA